MGIIVALLVLSFLIFFHELGHFMAARFFGVQVDVFSIGFGKKLYSRTIGKTQWSISAIPLGGYVKMKGQDDSDPTNRSQGVDCHISNSPQYDDDSYTTKKPWQRIVILLSGPFANFLLAFILYFAIANLGVPKLLAYVGTVGDDTPAMHAGLLKGDKLLQINAVNIDYWEDIGKNIEKSGNEISLIIDRNETILTLQLAPKLIEDKNVFGEKITRRIIGISPLGKQTTVHFGFIDGIDYAWEETKKASLLIVRSVQKLITGAVSPDKLGGVITIVDVTAQASSAGLLALLFFTALISVNLGILNLLPIPALDGGHIMFNLYEMLTGKTANDSVIMYMTIIGWLMLFGLMGLGLYNDINRLWGN